MKQLQTPLLFLLFLSTIGFAKQKEYGKQTDTTITVTVLAGENVGVRFPGIYHFPKGIGLKSLYGIAGGYAVEEGMLAFPEVLLKRKIDGKLSVFEYDNEQLILAEAKDIQLEDGDIVIFRDPHHLP